MADRKVIAVIGATGSQGGGLASAILSDLDGAFACRAITRNAASDKARALKAEGAEVVKADLDDVASLEKAFAGAYGAFCVTNFWEHFSAEKEKAQAKTWPWRPKKPASSTSSGPRSRTRASSCRQATSACRSCRKSTGCRTSTRKAEADAFFADLPITYLVTSFYWDNLYAFGLGPKKAEDGTYQWVLPMGDKRLAGIAAEDIGRVAYGIFKAGSKYIGKTIGIAGEFLPLSRMAAMLSKSLGVHVNYVAVEPDAYRGFGFPGADELGNMFQVYRDFEKEVVGARSADLASMINPSLLTFDEWLGKYKSRIPL